MPSKCDDWLGAPVIRREDDALLRGGGCFVDDVSPAGVLHAAFLRSPLVSAFIRAIDTSIAAKMEGVVAVYTGADLAFASDLPVNAIFDEMNVPSWPVLAQTRVDAVGQPVALVIATSLAIADDAVEQIELDLEADGGIGSGGKPHQCFRKRWWSSGHEKIDLGTLRQVSVAIDHARLAPCTLEPRATAADWNAGEGRLYVWLSSQTPHRGRQVLADILALDPTEIRVITRDVGGAFGMKASLYPEDVAIAFAARKLQRPVKWCASRSEDMLAASHGRGLTTSGKLYFDNAGRFHFLEAIIKAPLGHWLTYSAAVPAWNAGRILPGPYDLKIVDIETNGELCNAAPVGIYRGAGRPEAAMLMERLVDLAAAELGLGSFEIRSRNLLHPDAMAKIRPTGTCLDSGNYPELLQRLKTLSKFEDLEKKCQLRRSRGELIGIGTAFFVEPSGQGWESARLSVKPTGRIEVASGSSSQGQGRETALAQIAASVLHVGLDQIDVLFGDTDQSPAGIGALASRSTAIGGSAVLAAVRELKIKIEMIAGENSDCSEATLSALIAAKPESKETLSVEIVYDNQGEAWSYGCYLVLVSVDRDTGVVYPEKIFGVDDAGHQINPMLIKGQILGGMAQGLGEALLEQMIYDDWGQLLTGSLMDYALPRAEDIPAIELDMLETASPNNLLGAKGIGEAGTIGIPPAIVNAVLQALAPLGVTDIQMPATSETVWRAMREAGNPNWG